MRSSRRLGLSLCLSIVVSLRLRNHSSSVQAPTGLTYGAGSAVYTEGVGVTTDNPTSSGGAVTGYHVSPALPARIDPEQRHRRDRWDAPAVTPVAELHGYRIRRGRRRYDDIPVR